ncbi:hypothetical protein TIFTF001_024645 [Ficus carica]|uniref:F-box protein n=1 Tax=Ficus carica TaxID=3494 RepID=A0AA88AMF3_FICCA|nr:hypothetical protein TIFTF001_024645 [Ficus carica]
MDVRSLVSLAVTNHEFYKSLMDDAIWKKMIFRDMKIQCSEHLISHFCFGSHLKMHKLYALAFDVSKATYWRKLYSIVVDNAYGQRHPDICMRVGGFIVSSPEIHVLKNLIMPQGSIPINEHGSTFYSHYFTLTNVKQGLWIVDIDETTRILGVSLNMYLRHIDMSMYESFTRIDFSILGTYTAWFEKDAERVTAAVVNGENFESTIDLFQAREWVDKEEGVMATNSLHGVALNKEIYLQLQKDLQRPHFQVTALRDASQKICGLRIAISLDFTIANI